MFAPGQTTAVVDLVVMGDTIAEPPALFGEWALVLFHGPSDNATLELNFFGLGIGVIIDDD